MRRVFLPATFVLGVAGMALATGAGVAAAAPAGKSVCTITDERLAELSGLVATKTGYITVNDSTDQSNRKRIFYLSKSCEVQNAVSYSGDGPRDPEDLAVSPDGKTLWIADTGDNINSADPRSSIVLWSMPIAGNKQPELHRLAYPDGKSRDAEALLISGNGTPVIITKSPTKAELFVPAAPLQTANSTPVKLKAAGTLTLPKTTTPNPLSVLGRVTITGAARSPDGKKIALRTYADAFEWDLTGGDVVATLTSGTAPRITALADPFGESIAYSPDGKQFLTVSDGGQMADNAKLDILSYTPATAVVKPTAAAGAPAANGGGTSWTDRLSLQDLTYLVVAIGLIGAVLVGIGIMGILKARRRTAAGIAGSGAAATPKIGRQAVPAVDSWDEADRGFDPEPVGGRTGSVYGGSAAPGGAVYGGGVPGRSGSVYGGGNVYGGGGSSQGPSGGAGSSGPVRGGPGVGGPGAGGPGLGGPGLGGPGLGGPAHGGPGGSGGAGRGNGYGHNGWADEGAHQGNGWADTSYESGVPRAGRPDDDYGRAVDGYPDNGLRYR